MRIVFPLFDRFTALDAVGPYEVLSRLPRAEVLFVAEEPGPVRTDNGFLAITADAGLDNVSECDILVVPGGPGTEVMTPDHPLVEWVRTIHQTTRWTTSVCTGAEILGAAGLLVGLDATTHWASVAELESFGAKYSDKRVVIQGKIVTAAGVSSGIDMGLTLAALIAGDDYAQAIQLGIEYDPQPPFKGGSVASAPPAIVAATRAGLRAAAAPS